MVLIFFKALKIQKTADLLFYLNIGNAERLETLKINDELQVFSFFVAVTILHEFVHAGRIANKLEEPDEMGWDGKGLHLEDM